MLGVLTLPHELAWSGRRSFDLDDPYDLGALYKIVLEEGRQQYFRALLNGEVLRRHWDEFLPARRGPGNAGRAVSRVAPHRRLMDRLQERLARVRVLHPSCLRQPRGVFSYC